MWMLTKGMFAPSIRSALNRSTVLVGQDRQKIILKLNTRILGILFFVKKNLTLKKRILENISRISVCQTLFFQKINYSTHECQPCPTNMVLAMNLDVSLDQIHYDKTIHNKYMRVY